MGELLFMSMPRLTGTLLTISLAGFATGWLLGGRSAGETDLLSVPGQLSAAGANWVR
jgi:hypothetical protein